MHSIFEECIFLYNTQLLGGFNGKRIMTSTLDHVLPSKTQNFRDISKTRNPEMETEYKSNISDRKRISPMYNPKRIFRF